MQMKAQSGMNTAQDVLNQVIVNPEETGETLGKMCQ